MIAEWTLNIAALISNIATVITLLLGGAYAITSLRTDIRVLLSRVDRAETDLREIRNTISAIGMMTQRVIDLEGRVDLIWNLISRPTK